MRIQDAFRHADGEMHVNSFLADGIACTDPALGCVPVWFTTMPESYSVEEIQNAFADHAMNDSWGVPCFYEGGLISALRGEYGCVHRYSDGTRCTLSTAAHVEIPGLAEAHRCHQSS